MITSQKALNWNQAEPAAWLLVTSWKPRSTIAWPSTRFLNRHIRSSDDCSVWEHSSRTHGGALFMNRPQGSHPSGQKGTSSEANASTPSLECCHQIGTLTRFNGIEKDRYLIYLNNVVRRQLRFQVTY